jgi:hypothetical protein
MTDQEKIGRLCESVEQLINKYTSKAYFFNRYVPKRFQCDIDSEMNGFRELLKQIKEESTR